MYGWISFVMFRLKLNLAKNWNCPFQTVTNLNRQPPKFKQQVNSCVNMFLCACWPYVLSWHLLEQVLLQKHRKLHILQRYMVLTIHNPPSHRKTQDYGLQNMGLLNLDITCLSTWWAESPETREFSTLQRNKLILI